MKDSLFCDDFQDMLDSLASGTVPPDTIALLQSHAQHCKTCAMLLQIQENLAGPTVDEISGQIPERMLARVWDRVSADLPPVKRHHKPRHTVWTRRPWIVPALALTSILFILLNMFLLTEIRQIRKEERELSALLSRQTLALEELRDRTSGPRFAGSFLNRNRLRPLSGRQELTVAELRSILGQVPPDLQIVSGSYVRHLLSQMPRWERTKWQNMLEIVDAADGIQSREAIVLLDALALDPGEILTPYRLSALTEL